MIQELSLPFPSISVNASLHELLEKDHEELLGLVGLPLLDRNTEKRRWTFAKVGLNTKQALAIDSKVHSHFGNRVRTSMAPGKYVVDLESVGLRLV